MRLSYDDEEGDLIDRYCMLLHAIGYFDFG
jgi:hypothetical protein